MPTNLLNVSSGILSSSNLADATATTGDVLSGKTFYSGDEDLKTGTMISRGSSTSAVSVSTSGSNVTYRINQGAYMLNGSSGYPEVYSSRSNVLTAMNLNFSSGWEVIGFGGHDKNDMGNNVYNAQQYITWANGWSTNLPQGTYRVLVCFGQGDLGGIDIVVSIGGKDVSTPYGTKWNVEDCEFTGSGALKISYSDNTAAYRNPWGCVIVVCHKR